MQDCSWFWPKSVAVLSDWILDNASCCVAASTSSCTTLTACWPVRCRITTPMCSSESCSSWTSKPPPAAGTGCSACRSVSKALLQRYSHTLCVFLLPWTACHHCVVCSETRCAVVQRSADHSLSHRPELHGLHLHHGHQGHPGKTTTPHSVTNTALISASSLVTSHNSLQSSTQLTPELGSNQTDTCRAATLQST